MSLDTVAAEVQDQLIPGLDFRVSQQGASYILGRRFATFWPQGSDVYSPDTGVRMIRFVLSDATNFLDLSTFRIAFTFHNTGGNALQLTGHPGQSWCQRVRIYVSGCLVEDIRYANRVASMLNLCKPAQRRWSESIEARGAANDIPANAA